MSIENSKEGAPEPLEQEAQNGVADELPDPELLAELGFEVAQTTKPDETVADVIGDAADELVDPEATVDEIEEVEGLDEPKGKNEPKSKASKRIQALVKEKKAAEARLAQRDSEFQQQLQGIRQQQAMQARAMESQNAVLQRQLEVMSRRAPAPEEDLSKLTPMEQYERKILMEAERRAEAKINPRVQALEARLQQQEEEKKALVKRSRQQATLQQFTEKANIASKTVLMSDVDVTGFAADDAAVASDLVLAYVAATGAPPEEAAQHFKRWLDKYHQGRLRNVSKTSGKTIQQSQRVPAPVQQSRGAVQSEQKPTWDVLHKHGYDNYVQWINAGSPALSTK